MFANAVSGSVVIDMSTVYPETSQELSRLSAERGVEVLDVTISGEYSGRRKWAADFVWWRRQAVLRRCGVHLSRYLEKVFLSWAKRLRGDDETGGEQLLGIGMQAIAEAVALGEKAGLDRIRLLSVLSQTAVVAPAHVGKLEKATRTITARNFRFD